MFKSLREEVPVPETKSSTPKAKQAEKDDQDHEQDQDVGTPVDARVKELYRRLVRRLHPDLRADGSADVSALWHEVQEAYMASDVARLEILLALSNIRANEMGDDTSLAQMRSVLAELNRSVCALEKSLLEAEGEDAWNFARSGPNEDLRKRVERQLRFDLATRARVLEVLKKTIADWARGPVLRRTSVSVERRQFA
jgi:hypothetical protein